ncbi:MAG: YtxH domain-containing protein [Actinomycetota bacterium]
MGFRSGVLVGFGIGYVLGSKAGRERYEDIRRAWNAVTGSHTVQRAVATGKEAAETGARKGLSVVQQGVDKATGAIKERRTRVEDGSFGEIPEV